MRAVTLASSRWAFEQSGPPWDHPPLTGHLTLGRLARVAACRQFMISVPCHCVPSHCHAIRHGRAPPPGVVGR
jgi:hypothetical protein